MPLSILDWGKGGDVGKRSWIITIKIQQRAAGTAFSEPNKYFPGFEKWDSTGWKLYIYTKGNMMDLNLSFILRKILLKALQRVEDK